MKDSGINYLDLISTGSPVSGSISILTKNREFCWEDTPALAATSNASPTWLAADEPWLRPLFFSEICACETDRFKPFSVCTV